MKPRAPRSRRHATGGARRGTSMVEVVTIVLVSSILLAMAISMMHTLLRVDRSGRARLVDRASLGELGQLFRSDARAALELSLGELEKKAVRRPAPQAAALRRPNAIDAATLGHGLGVLALPGQGEVEYRLHEDRLIRIVWQAGELRHQDSFRLPRGSAAHIELSGEEEPRTAALVFENAPGTRNEGPLREYRVESVLGRDHRFETRRD